MDIFNNMKITLFLLLLLLLGPSLGLGQTVPKKSEKPLQQMDNRKPRKGNIPVLKHPGFIISVEYPGEKETKKSIEGVPLKHQFVFLKNGQEVESADDADTIVPIVRVEAHFTEDRKRIIEIKEIGPDGHLLRRTYGAH